MSILPNKRTIVIGVLASATIALGGYLAYRLFLRKLPISTFPEEEKSIIPYIDPEFNVRPSLTYEETEGRLKAVSDLKYLLTLSLSVKENYDGCIEIRFTLKEKSNDIFLDYNGSEVKFIKINGNLVSCEEIFSKHKIIIPYQKQEIGENIVNVYENIGQYLL